MKSRLDMHSRVRQLPRRWPIWPRGLIACLAFLSFVQPGHAQGQASTAQLEEFVFGNLQFVLLHELAHLVINEKHIPVLGPEEFAADYIAAMLLIRPRAEPATGYDTLLRFAVDTADGFVMAWEDAAERSAEIPYWGTHALTVQRFSTIACLLYGSDPERFSALPERVQMHPERARFCPMEYAKAVHAIDWVFENYARAPGDPPGAEVELHFEVPPSRTSRQWLAAIRAHGFVERTFEGLEQYFALLEPISFVMRACRQPQAAWFPETRELVVCYELVDAYVLMGARQADRTIRPLLAD